jgi:hypothetical protein
VRGERGIRRALTLALLLAALVPVGLARADGGWVGDHFGWRLRGGVDATTDGGRHWRTILCCEGVALQMAHTGPTTGMAALGDEQYGFYDYFWTVDNGRHWYVFDGSGADAIGGHGQFLFWEDTNKRGVALYQARPWPPAGRALRCKTPFSPVDGVPGLFCDEPARQPRLVRVTPRIAGADGVGGLVSVPGGTVALALRHVLGDTATPLLQLLVRRRGETFVIPLPAATGGALAYYAPTLAANWPFVQVTAGTADGRSVVWTSYDGARTWSVTPAS